MVSPFDHSGWLGIRHVLGFAWGWKNWTLKPGNPFA